MKLTRYERRHDADGVQRPHRRIKEIGAEIRDIDPMMNVLTVRLLGKHRAPAAS